MLREPFTFRHLYHILQAEYLGDPPGQSLPLAVLLAWTQRLQPEMDRLRPYAPADARHRCGDQVIPDLWALYALSRVSDLLALPFQPEPVAPRRVAPVPMLTAEAYQAFWEELGLQVLIPTHYHPFTSEIAEVVQAPDPAIPPQLVAVRWPGLQFGDLVIARAGVAVWGGRDHVRADIAPRSALYFAYRRRYRATEDLSMGWGANSQWRTRFRRDYADADTYYYNVDGAHDLSDPALLHKTAQDNLNDDLTLAQRLELLRHRCFVTCDRPWHDWWPYDDFAREPREGS